MSNFLTPGVYTQEVPVLPQSVAGVSTAIPAFIGYTEKAVKSSKNVSNTAIRITTFLEYKEVFGMAAPSDIKATITEDRALKFLEAKQPKSILYYALDMYFKNGGGDCYIISVGSYDDDYLAQNFLDGLTVLANEDEPTLIVLGDAVNLETADYHTVCEKALLQCENLKDRFCIFDIQHKDVSDASVTSEMLEKKFREGIGNEISKLKYGAAYTPFLQTALNHVYTDSDVIISSLETSPEGIVFSKDYKGIKISFRGSESDEPKFKINAVVTNSTAKSKTSLAAITFDFSDKVLTINGVPTGGILPKDLLTEWEKVTEENQFDIIVIKEEELVVASAKVGITLTPEVRNDDSELTLHNERGTALYSEIVNVIAKERIVLPPSGALAGIYAATDRQRGVWKAPANVSLNSVIAPVRKINSDEQEKLNVDESGKSINAIRSFVGKGTLVWGARTLAGNDNEWRYIPVRRLFNMIEEATKKASFFAVFEANDATTWLKVKAMIESYLYGIWQQGGLAGSTEEQAYFVNIGLGKTMTQEDILAGRMIVEIGVAATRPAEFIILKFSHKLQEV